jgi:hypothetical protein
VKLEMDGIFRVMSSANAKRLTFISWICKVFQLDIRCEVRHDIASHARVSARSWAGGFAPVHPRGVDLRMVVARV